MWISFFITFLTAAVVLIIPGGLILASLGVRPLKALCCAPALSAVVLCIEALLLSGAGIPASPAWFLAPPVLVAALIAALRRLARLTRSSGLSGTTHVGGTQLMRSEFVLGAYLLVGLVSVALIFVKQLDGAGSLNQIYDSYMHVGLIRSFLESADFSFISTSLYRDLSVLGASPVQGYSGGFYPAAWHIITSLTVLVTHASIPVAVNAVNTAIVGVVCPLASFCLMCELFPDKPRYVLAGALATMCIALSPWDFIIFGPLYPNNLANVMVPLVCACFIACTRAVEKRGFRRSLGSIILFTLISAGVAFSHPSGIFMAAVFLTPYCAFFAWRISVERFGVDGLRRFPVPLLVCATVAAIWVACYKSPFFAAAVKFNWPATTSKSQALIDVLTLGMSDHPVQLLVSALMWIGFVALLCDRARRWLCIPFLFTAFTYFVDVSTEGTLKHVLAGFWYADPHRISAMVGTFAVPLVAVGAAVTCEAFSHGLLAIPALSRTRSVLTRALVALITFVAIFYPSFTLRGYGLISTGFGYVSTVIFEQNSENSAQILSKTEEDFYKRVLNTIPHGSLVLNSPNDGSLYLYALYDAKVYYREFDPNHLYETSESALIREHLAELDTRKDVREAVKKVGAHYLLILDLKGHDDPTRLYSTTFFPEQWAGVDAVNDETPGFTPILSEGDMRLYRIDTVV